MIKWIIILVVALLVLSYFGFSLRTLVDQPVTQDNFTYVATSTVTVWDKYLKQPASYVWNGFVNLVVTPALYNLMQMKNGQPTNISTSAPMLPPLPPPVQ